MTRTVPCPCSTREKDQRGNQKKYLIRIGPYQPILQGYPTNQATPILQMKAASSHALIRHGLKNTRTSNTACRRMLLSVLLLEAME